MFSPLEKHLLIGSFALQNILLEAQHFSNKFLNIIIEFRTNPDVTRITKIIKYL